MKVRVLGGETLEFFAIIKILLAAHPEQQPELMVLMPLRIGEQPVQHRTEGSNAGPGRDENRMAHRRTQNEIAERTLKGDLRAFREAAKMVGHESVVDAVQAKCDTAIFRGRRGDRVGAGDFLALRRCGFE